MNAFARELRASIDRKRPRALIVDVRHNQGGDAQLLAEFVRTVIHYETTGESAATYVVMGRNTFSAAQTLLNLLEQLTDATFVGEPSGTRPNRFGNEAPLLLPCSGIRGTVSSGYNQGATSRDHRVWIPPDIPVELSARQYLRGEDPVLDAILKLHEPEKSR